MLSTQATGIPPPFGCILTEIMTQRIRVFQVYKPTIATRSKAWNLPGLPSRHKWMQLRLLGQTSVDFLCGLKRLTRRRSEGGLYVSALHNRDSSDFTIQVLRPHTCVYGADVLCTSGNAEATGSVCPGSVPYCASASQTTYLHQEPPSSRKTTRTAKAVRPQWGTKRITNEEWRWFRPLCLTALKWYKWRSFPGWYSGFLPLCEKHPSMKSRCLDGVWTSGLKLQHGSVSFSIGCLLTLKLSLWTQYLTLFKEVIGAKCKQVLRILK